ncbi:YcaO-like family protein [Micromonospora endolithica]|uniref:YcaO-like family protein n=1 Tax=Micromonospora endolithica TaxID=230091 RepID=UPI0011ABD478|nr:YcaO-like family protein [Micromonospora endolithica]TWJ21260.1 ribosomal protein S12 methylthiotransferase accessory factor [Micromonospora endolithica]
MPFRSVTAECALATASAEINRLGLTARAAVLGVAASPTTRVTLFRDGARVAVGAGKGTGHQGAASAYFEALERYLMSARDNRRWTADATRLLSATVVAGQSALESDLVVRRWAAEFPDAVAACASYGGVRYPTFLTDPRYYRWPVAGDDVRPYRSLLRYSSSLGTAAGVDLAEAVYHGLCELIEHDGLGQALLRWFVAGVPDVDLVPVGDLPDGLRSLHAEAERAAGAPVHLLDVTTDLDVPVYLAVSRTADGEPTRLGAGASLWATDAASRALGELIQVCALSPSAAGSPAGQRLATWPALQRCASMPLDQLLSGPVRAVPLRADVAGDGSPGWGLEHVGRALARHGIGYHVCEIAPVGSPIAVATTIAPGLERFSLVRHGVPVIPTGRGWHLWPSPDQATITRPHPVRAR